MSLVEDESAGILETAYVATVENEPRRKATTA
jgi:hypothetical protein